VRWRGQTASDRADHLKHGLGHMPRFVEQAQLVDCRWPHHAQDGWIEGGSIGDHLLRYNPGLVEPCEKGFDGRGVDGAMDQLIANQPIAIRRSGVDGQKQGKLALIDFVDTQDARELADNPRLVIDHKVEGVTIRADPATNHAFVGLNPNVSGEAYGDTAHGHAIKTDGLDGFLNHTVGVDGIGTEKWRLGTEIMVAGVTLMDTHRNEQQDRVVKLNIDGGAGRGPDGRRRLGAAIAREGVLDPCHFPDVTGRVRNERRI
jgi:hypothetical protein